MPSLNIVKFTVEDFDDYFRLVSNQDVMAQITERAIPMEEARSNYDKLIGYMLLPEHWGSGYGTEIAKILIDLAKQADLRKLTATIDPANAASRKILINQQFVSEKIGEIDGLPGEILSRTL